MPPASNAWPPLTVASFTDPSMSISSVFTSKYTTGAPSSSGPPGKKIARARSEADIRGMGRAGAVPLPEGIRLRRPHGTLRSRADDTSPPSDGSSALKGLAVTVSLASAAGEAEAWWACAPPATAAASSASDVDRRRAAASLAAAGARGASGAAAVKLTIGRTRRRPERPASFADDGTTPAGRSPEEEGKNGCSSSTIMKGTICSWEGRADASIAPLAPCDPDIICGKLRGAASGLRSAAEGVRSCAGTSCDGCLAAGAAAGVGAGATTACAGGSTARAADVRASGVCDVEASAIDACASAAFVGAFAAASLSVSTPAVLGRRSSVETASVPLSSSAGP